MDPDADSFSWIIRPETRPPKSRRIPELDVRRNLEIVVRHADGPKCLLKHTGRRLERLFRTSIKASGRGGMTRSIKGSSRAATRTVRYVVDRHCATSQAEVYPNHDRLSRSASSSHFYTGSWAPIPDSIKY